MPNAHITITPEEFKEVKKRIDKLETIPEVSDIKETKEKVQGISILRVEMNEKFNTMDEKFNTMNEKFNSLEKRFTMLWALQIVTFLAILGLYLKGIVF
jgi:predicted nuclease with TOPRIM domain